jgi:hypothetical protein
VDGTLVVSRKLTYRDRFRSYKVRVDGNTVGQIGRDSPQHFNMPAGQHSVSLHVDWCRSPTVEVDVPSGGSVSLRCRASGGAWRVLWDITFGKNRYITLQIQTAN